MTIRAKRRASFDRMLTAKMAPKRIWQSALALIILTGIYLFLPPAEITIARQWLETFWGRLR
jgi:hypothetical protein